MVTTTMHEPTTLAAPPRGAAEWLDRRARAAVKPPAALPLVRGKGVPQGWHGEGVELGVDCSAIPG